MSPAGADRGLGTMSRRQLLAGMTAVGATGGFVGLSTGANLIDRERLAGSITAGLVDLEVDWRVLMGPDAGATGSSDAVVEIPINAAPGETGTARLDLSLPGDANNPSYLWLRSDCPSPPATALGEQLDLTLSYADATGVASGDPIATGSFRQVLSDLRNGIALDGSSDPATGAGSQACLDGGDTLSLRLEWTLSAAYIGSESTSATLAFVATQCRNSDGATNPFGNVTTPACPPGEICESCEYLGKLNLEDDDRAGIGDSYVESGQFYPFDEGATDYGILVVDTEEKVETNEAGATERETVAIEFVVLGPDDETLAPCTVKVKSGTETEQYDRIEGTVPASSRDLEGSSDGLLYSPRRSGSGEAADDPAGEFFGISHISVFVCVADGSEDR